MLLDASDEIQRQGYLTFWLLVPKSTHRFEATPGKRADHINHILNEAKPCLPAPGSV